MPLEGAPSGRYQAHSRKIEKHSIPPVKESLEFHGTDYIEVKKYPKVGYRWGTMDAHIPSKNPVNVLAQNDTGSKGKSCNVQILIQPIQIY